MSAKLQGIRSWMAVAGVVVCLAGVGSFLYFLEVRESTVREIGESAQRAFGGERVDALIATASSVEVALEKRNRAVWALGEIRDPRALAVLQQLEVQEECNHTKLVCQREVRKAIAKIQGESSPLHTLGWGWERLRLWIDG